MGKCLLANQSVERLSYIDPEKRQSEKTKYERHLLEAIASALSIKDKFYKGLAIRQVINVCRNANELDIEKTLFKEVDHDLLREQIVKGAPELASERKKLSDEESACRTTTIHLDGLDRDAIVHLVTKAMRGISASECEIEGFKDDIKNADHDTMLAKAINWGAPVNFLKDGQPWVAGDWRRLSLCSEPSDGSPYWEEAVTSIPTGRSNSPARRESGRRQWRPTLRSPHLTRRAQRGGRSVRRHCL